MKIFIFYIFLFLLMPFQNSYASVIYKNLAAQSMFQSGSLPNLEEIKFLKNQREVEGLELQIQEARLIEDKREKYNKLYVLFSKVKKEISNNENNERILNLWVGLKLKILDAFDKLAFFLFQEGFRINDIQLIREFLNIIIENHKDKLPLISSAILEIYQNLLQQNIGDLATLRNNLFTLFYYSLEQREEGIKGLISFLSANLQEESKARKDFLDFANLLLRDWKDAYPYEYVYRNIEFFLKEDSSDDSVELLQLPIDILKIKLEEKGSLSREGMGKKDIMSINKHVFFISLLIAIKSKDVNKYKVALEKLRTLISDDEYSEAYLNLFVAAWNTYKEQPCFRSGPVVVQIDDECKNRIQEFYVNDINKIIDFWRNFDKEKGETVKSVTEFLPSKSSVVADIHGEINGIIFPLVSRGLIRLTGNIIFWDLKTRQRVSQLSTTVVVLPEIEIALDYSKGVEIFQFLGDIIDRGKFTDECIAFLDYFFKQNQSLIKINLLFGNHESNLFDNGGSTFPPYNGRNFLLVRAIVKDWIRLGKVRYSYVEDSWLYTHSFVSIEFLKNLYDSLDEYGRKLSLPFCRINQAKAAINWFLNGKAAEPLLKPINVSLYERSNLDFNSQDYINNLKILDLILNEIFMRQMNLVFEKNFISKTDCLFTVNSPIWARPEELNCTLCSNIKNGFGHNPTFLNDSGGMAVSEHSVNYDCSLSYGIWLFENKNAENVSSCKYNLGRSCIYLNSNPVYFRSGIMKGFEAVRVRQSAILEKVENAELVHSALASQA